MGLSTIIILAAALGLSWLGLSVIYKSVGPGLKSGALYLSWVILVFGLAARLL